MDIMRVLIADRDENLLEDYGRFLASRDVETSLVTSSVDCTVCLQDSHPDVLVLDPGLLWGGGDGLLDRMYTERDLPEVPVILLVAGGQADQLYRALEYPIDEFLLKPVHPRDLLKKIRWVHYSRGPDTLFRLPWSGPTSVRNC